MVMDCCCRLIKSKSALVLPIIVYNQVDPCVQSAVLGDDKCPSFNSAAAEDFYSFNHPIWGGFPTNKLILMIEVEHFYGVSG